MSFWSNKKVLVTGGASFIGSHLVDRLIASDVSCVRVVDDLSSGLLENIAAHIDSGCVEFRHADLLDSGVAKEAVEGIDVVFHLAAKHGGRGYVESYQATCAHNFAIDGLVIKAAVEARVGQFVYASSGCVYPLYLQRDQSTGLGLSEGVVGPPCDADHIYGWAKLMGELTLQALYGENNFHSVSCRLFTVYGERGLEDHAIMAMIARMFVEQDPIEIWGGGEQVRNWTYVGDTVSGMMLAAEKVDDASSVNIGSEEVIRVSEAIEHIGRCVGRLPNIRWMPDLPVGPRYRSCSAEVARQRLGWRATVPFNEGVRRTVEWYFAVKDRDIVRSHLAELVMGSKRNSVK